MKNTFYKILSIAVLLIAGSAVYYFVFYIPNYNQEKMELNKEIDEKKSEDDKFAMKKKCSDVCSDFYELDTKDHEDSSFEIGIPEYTYNSALNTCLYYNSEHSSNNTMTSYSDHYIKDCFTHERIDGFVSFNEFDLDKYDEFKLRKENLWDNLHAIGLPDFDDL